MQSGWSRGPRGGWRTDGVRRPEEVSAPDHEGREKENACEGGGRGAE